jgi:glutamate-1-semialdehyde 2,1-aminomutase
MKSCIEQGRKDIVLFFNTNCTNINKNFLELISQFDTVNINASLDGVGIVNEYIRAPSDWTQISSNIEKLAQMPNVHLGITPTVQVYNVFDLVNIIKWVEDLNNKFNKNSFIDFLVNTHPHHLNVNILPNELKKEALDELVAYRDNYMQVHNHMTMNSLNGIIGLLQQPRTENWKEEVERFRTFTLSLDQHRNQTIKDLDPRIAGLMND